MLVSLSIRDVVLIERLDLTFEAGLCVLTGETGAGKSILLDALGLALGKRADAGLIRPGAPQASVAAAFEVGQTHPANDILAELDLTPGEGQIVLRRTLAADGRSRAYVNDQPVTVSLLRRLGDFLVEIQGQFEQRGLLDTAAHRDFLDIHAGAEALAKGAGEAWAAWRAKAKEHQAAQEELAKARREEAYLRGAAGDLEALSPRPGEEQVLRDQREMLMNAERLIEAVAAAAGHLNGGESDGGGAESALAATRRVLERVAAKAGGRLEPALAALDRAMIETAEAEAQILAVSTKLEHDSSHQEEIDTRYFALKELARKHDTDVNGLALIYEGLSARLAAIDSGGAHLAALERAARAAREAYLKQAQALSAARRKAAKSLDAAVARELPPLKLERARFQTRIDSLEEDDWGPSGLDRIAFEIATAPGAAPGPMSKIASGGELARFLLALKVVLSAAEPGRSLVFDEVDSGIGGATAHAVGERLARLAHGRQVLVVTHSPQVGARGAYHLRVHKEAKGKRLATRVVTLDLAQRREEIARMLSGAQITEEARAAARRLIEADVP